MWTRAELKKRAKDALRRNYWKIVLVTFLAVILYSNISATTAVSGGSGATVDDDRTDRIVSVHVDYPGGTESDSYESTPDADSGIIDKVMRPLNEEMSPTDLMIFRISMVVIFIMVYLLLCAFVYALIALLSNPFYIGVCRFMLKSVDDKAEVKEVAYGFDHSYKNVVKTMFFMDLKVFAWSLLFIIPGIYKKYQYRMVPYILAEHPDMDYKAVHRLSSDIMDGQKWKSFVLDLSFVPWHMLGLITCGIVEVFFVSPYVYLTHAALCRRLCELWEDKRRQAVGEVGEQNGV